MRLTESQRHYKEIRARLNGMTDNEKQRMNSILALKQQIDKLSCELLERDQKTLTLNAEIDELRAELAKLREDSVDPSASGVSLCPPSVGDIKRAVATYFKTTIGLLESPRREVVAVYHRHIAMYLAQNYSRRSLPQIGKLFGDRDHTTVLHGIRRITKRIAEGEENVIRDVDAVMDAIRPARTPTFPALVAAPERISQPA